VWVVDDGTLAADARETLVQGASTAALLLLRARAAQELARHQNSDLLRRLLDGTADAVTAADRLGVEGPVRVAAFVLDVAGLPDAEQTGLRLLDVVRLQCEARYGRHACVPVDGVVYALLPAAGEYAGGRHKRLAEDIVARAGQALRVPVRAGLGEVVAGLGEAALSRADADLVLRVLGPSLPVATVEEVRPRVTLLRLTEVLGERRELSTGAWQRVLAHDGEHGTDYARTLVCWFDAGCDMAGAAKLLAVHPNTCRYRLKQVREHVGVDLDDPDERLVLWLQLRTLAGVGPVLGRGG
jgi:sugar diacid utilization regulator